MMHTDSEAFWEHQKEADGALQKRFSFFLRGSERGSELNVVTSRDVADMIRARIGTDHKGLKEKLYF